MSGHYCCACCVPLACVPSGSCTCKTMTEETYVLGETEVKKTGRQAEKDLPGGKQKMVVVEVTPVNDNDGTWKKWVNPTTLFKIKEA